MGGGGGEEQDSYISNDSIIVLRSVDLVGVGPLRGVTEAALVGYFLPLGGLGTPSKHLDELTVYPEDQTMLKYKFNPNSTMSHSQEYNMHAYHLGIR